MVRHHPKEGTERGSSACMGVCLESQAFFDGTSCQRLTCAAPPPSLHLTGERVPVHPLFDEDGTRTQRCFEVAEHRRLDCCTRHGHGDCTSRSVWGSPAGAPACAITSAHVADGHRCWNPPGGKKSKKPLTGYFCPLTTGGLIRVSPALTPAATPVTDGLNWVLSGEYLFWNRAYHGSAP